LADYVPFYFAPRSPMLGAIHVGKVPAYRDGQENIVHLVSSTKSVAEAGVSFVFTDGHAVMAISRFFTDLQDLDRIDWDVVSVEQKHWFDTQEDPDRLRRRQAEFLVRDFFPWPLITQIGVMTERVAETVREALAATEHRPPVIVRGTKWYFEPRDADMYRQKP
jgi:hypothetical protein